MKINGWEMIFVQMIEDIRHFEIIALLKTNFLRAMNEAIFFVSPVLVGFFTFITYSKTGGVLTVAKVLTVLTLFNIMQMSMTKFFPFAIQFSAEAKVSTQRIQKVLLLEESDSLLPSQNNITTNPNNNDKTTDQDNNSNNANNNSNVNNRIMIKFEKFYASWLSHEPLSVSNQLDNNMTTNTNTITTSTTNINNKELPVEILNVNFDPLSINKTEALNDHNNNNITNKDPTNLETADISTNTNTNTTAINSTTTTLHDINLTITEGELIVIVGPVGCSKTSLLLAILKELPSLQGSLFVSHLSTSRNITHANNASTSLTNNNNDNTTNSNTNNAINSTNSNAKKSSMSSSQKYMDEEEIAYCSQEPWILSASVSIAYRIIYR